MLSKPQCYLSKIQNFCLQWHTTEKLLLFYWYGLLIVVCQRRYDTRHEMLTQRNPFCHHVNTKKGTLSQHFVTHAVPPLVCHHFWGSKRAKWMHSAIGDKQNKNSNNKKLLPLHSASSKLLPFHLASNKLLPFHSNSCLHSASNKLLPFHLAGNKLLPSFSK
jgi:hypothetical protein